jgi:cysteinyl-tRNA synthetase
MAKRKGNIKYPRTLLGTECIWNHIRFFFIYGHYRKKLNFTFNDYNNVCKLLRNFREMIRKITVHELSRQKSNTETKELVNKIKIDFEKNMNNDLQVKTAFDSLFNTVSKLVKLNDQKKLSFEDSKKVLKELKLIDSVFQVLF